MNLNSWIKYNMKYTYYGFLNINKSDYANVIRVSKNKNHKKYEYYDNKTERWRVSWKAMKVVNDNETNRVRKITEKEAFLEMI